MSLAVEVLVPGRDAEPGYWPSLRERAGLLADWRWDVMTAQAAGQPGRRLVTVVHGGDGPVAVVGADRIGRLGGLHVRSPASATVPGWWLAPGTPVGALRAYAVSMRRALGIGCAGVLLRQVGETDVRELRAGRRPAVVRATEPVWRLSTADWTDRDDWLRTLGKKRRSSLRTGARALDEAVETRVEAGSDIEAPAVANLMRHNEAKYRRFGRAHVRESPDHLARLLRCPDVVCTSYRERGSGRLLGLGIVFDHPEWPVWHRWSMVPVDAGGVKGLYFGQVVRLVDWALAGGKRGVLLGKGLAEVKAAVGAAPVAQYAVALPAW